MKKQLLLAATIFCFLNLINAQPGQLDSSFGNRGIVKTDLGKSYSYNAPPVNKIIPQPDGSMFITQGTVLSKRSSNGSIDESFGGKEYSADAGFTINDAAIQPDGKIVVVGAVRINNGNPSIYQSNYALARYNTDGTLDRSFSGDGKLTTDLDTIKRSDNEDDYQSYDEAFSVAIQNDGKIIAAGHSNNYLSTARYNTDGSLDSSFDRDGLVISSIYNYVNRTSIAIQEDGKLVIAGNSLIVRYNADGSQDNTFDGNGLNALSGFFSVVAQKDSKIVIAGYASNNSGTFGAIGRLNTDGSLDSSFSNDGMQPTDFIVNSVALQADGKIVTGGSISTVDSTTGAKTYYFAVARYNTNGNTDQSFSGDGKQITIVGTGYISTATVAIQSDGKIVAGGESFPYLLLIRYNTNGSLDKSFDEDGKVFDLFHAGNTVFRKIAAQKDGKIVAVGSTWNGSKFVFAIVRYNTNGGLDNTFSGDGIQTTAFADDAYANSITTQNDGKIIAAGGSYIARYNTDGTLDSTFSENGKLTSSVIDISEITIQGNGKIVAAGGETNNPAIARYNVSGSLDQTFGINGKQTFELATNEEGSFSSIVIQKDGKIVAAGIIIDQNDPYPGSPILVRLNANGGIDSTFGYLGTTKPSFQATSCDLIMQNDGKMVVAGSGSPHDIARTSLFRYNTNGRVDSSFNAVGFAKYYANPKYTSLALQSDGKIVVSGVKLGRLNTDGSLDSTFNIDALEKVDFGIQDIAIGSNKLYAAGGGYFGTVARYLLNGKNNTPPIVSITTPTNNATYGAGAYIKINAMASDTNGTISKVEFYNGTALLHTETVAPYGYQWKNVPEGSYTLTVKATDNSGLVNTSAAVYIIVVPNIAPAVNITNPVNHQTIAGPATIQLSAKAKDPDGKITSVEFYNGTRLLKIEYQDPYTFSWKNVPVGNYQITAKATDNRGAVTTSAVVNMSLVPNKAPTVNITNPANNESFTAPATIPLIAAAQDPDGTISKVEFYNGTTLLNTQYESPYTPTMRNVPAGTYTITAKAIDNLGLASVSAPITVTVAGTNTSIVSSKPSSADNRTGKSDAISLNIYPNPASNTLNIYTRGLQQNRQATISVISASGVVMKTVQSNSSMQTMQLDVSSLVTEVYTIKIISGDKVMYKQFVKL